MGESASVEDDRHAVVVVQLALGSAQRVDAGVDWAAIFARAIHERCAALAWHRSAAIIRAHAPSDVVAAWRSHALRAVDAGREMALELATATHVLGGASASPIVLKGLPLAVRLYGEAWVRPTSDMDLYVPVDDRRACHRALLAAGWTHLEGLPPGESTYERHNGGVPVHLELHSSLFDDNILSHIDAPHPDAALVDVDGTAVYALTGPLEPVFLAAHLAKHARAALLWWVDLAALWDSTPAQRREASRALAADLRLERYLAWAEQGLSLLQVIARGGVPAEDAYRRLHAMHRTHNARRVLGLAAGVRDKWKVFAAWIWPVAHRGHPASFLHGIVRRTRERLLRYAGRPAADHGAGGMTDTASRVASTTRVLPVDSPEFLTLVRAVVSEGGALWVRVRGTSMIPSIPRDAAVLLRPVGAEGVSIGDVALAELPDGTAVLHRVLSVGEGVVVMKGDNLPRADAPISADRLLAVARDIETREGRIALPRRPVQTLRSMVSRLRRRVQNA